MPTVVSLKVVTLNMGRGFPGLERSMHFLSNGQWDIACIQDVRETHVPMLAELFPGAQYFAPMTKHYIDGQWVSIGLGIFSRVAPFRSIAAHAYVGNVLPAPAIEGVEMDEQGDARPVDLARVRATENRIALFATTEVDGASFHVGTTHGVWVPQGIPDDHQRVATRKLRNIIVSQEECIIAGDFNAARGGEIYNLLSGSSKLRDSVPVDIANSVDWQMRGKEGPDLLVDYFFTTGNVYSVSNVEAHFGVSDHAALSATVSRTT